MTPFQKNLAMTLVEDLGEHVPGFALLYSIGADTHYWYWEDDSDREGPFDDLEDCLANAKLVYQEYIEDEGPDADPGFKEAVSLLTDAITTIKSSPNHP